jgi:hypothetical protein
LSKVLQEVKVAKKRGKKDPKASIVETQTLFRLCVVYVVIVIVVVLAVCLIEFLVVVRNSLSSEV